MCKKVKIFCLFTDNFNKFGIDFALTLNTSLEVLKYLKNLLLTKTSLAQYSLYRFALVHYLII